LKKILINKADWIIIDAPCTGVGTLRRNPDIKLRFNDDYLKKNTLLQ
jgi:16S rRNA (cytosine967-C5)-methyltransferase